jgi:PPOX class probable F420-dependent enzyme
VRDTGEQRAFLAEHVWAVLATGRADGSPQQAMVGYTLDAEGRILISTPTTSAKWRNAMRRPSVALTVPDGRRHLVVYGVAEGIVDDPERAELTADVLAVVRGPRRPDPSSLLGWLEAERRGVLRITPGKVLAHD